MKPEAREYTPEEIAYYEARKAAGLGIWAPGPLSRLRDFVRILSHHAQNFGASWKDFVDPGRVMVHGRNLRRLEQLLDQMEVRVHRARTSPTLDADIARWCAEGREILASPYYLPAASNVVQMRREEVG
ncbi:MAG TPA: hypothetical protein VNL71_23325 [Chloroflexota bacterium]|nr:hypothetical protein [Chloroflexota bacterium]